MKRIVFLLLFCICATTMLRGAAPANLIGNLSGRTTISLNGTWRIIVDPYENGLGSHYFENRKPKDKSDRVE